MVTIAVTAERDGEPRVAVSPETVKKLIALGCTVRVQAGAGAKSRFSDETLKAQGATVAASAAETLAGADILLKVRRPSSEELKALKPGAILTGTVMGPAGPVAGADVDVYTAGNDKLFTPSDNTTAAGVFSVIVPAGPTTTYQVRVDPLVSNSLVGTRTASFPFPASTNIGTINLVAGVPLNLTVLDAAITRNRWAGVPTGGPDQWAMQSHTLAKAALLAPHGNADEAYYRAQLPVIDERLALAGLRLAALINRSLATAPPVD